MSAQPLASAQLMPEADKYNFSFNGGFFSTQVDCSLSSATLSSLPSDASATERLRYIYTWLRGKGLNPIQAAAAVGNIAHESRGDPTLIQYSFQGRYGMSHTNDPSPITTGGWGLIQWDPGKKVIDIAKNANINGPIYDMNTQLEVVYYHMTKVSATGARNMLEGFQDYTQRSQLKSAVIYYELKMEGAGVKAYDNRYAAAQNALELYESGSHQAYTMSASSQNTAPDASALAATGIAQNGCAPSAGTTDPSDAGLIALIQKYAWPTPDHKPTGEQTEAYRSAIAAAKALKKFTGGANGNDCGAFVTRLMQDSGRDPAYGGGGNTTSQLKYLKDHPELYKKVSFAEVKFGDIGIFTGHTFMYIGNKVPGFKHPVVEAAFRNGEASSAPRNINSLDYNNSHGAVYYRYIGGNRAL